MNVYTRRISCAFFLHTLLVSSIRLPQLQPNETLNEWFERATLPRVQYDSHWWNYQQKVLILCAALWDSATQDSKKIAVSFYLKRWMEEMPQFGKFIFVPLPWHHIVEQCGMLRKNYVPLRHAAEIFESLQDDKYNHFSTIGQASFRQIQKYSRRGGFEFKHLDKLTLIFTSRLENVDRIANEWNLKTREVPIPLLHPRMMEVPLNSFANATSKNPSVFFSGGCTSPVRYQLKNLTASKEYNMSGIRSCLEPRLPRSEFYTQMQKSMWVITPRGSYPAAYMMSETIQCGSLPIYIYGWKDNSTAPLPAVEKIIPFLPFYNVGVDWRDLGLVLNANEIESIPKLLAQIDPNPRLKNVLRLRALFTLEGAFRYMLVVLSQLAASSSSVSELITETDEYRLLLKAREEKNANSMQPH